MSFIHNSMILKGNKTFFFSLYKSQISLSHSVFPQYFQCRPQGLLCNLFFLLSPLRSLWSTGLLQSLSIPLCFGLYVSFASFQAFPIFSSSFNLVLFQLCSGLPCFLWPCGFPSGIHLSDGVVLGFSPCVSNPLPCSFLNLECIGSWLARFRYH